MPAVRRTERTHTRSARLRRCGLAIATMATCVLSGRAIAGGNAASLGGLSSDPLIAFDRAAATGAPALTTCDNFDLSDGDLAGRTVSDSSRCGGLSWTVHTGSWTVSGGRVTGSGATPAVATLSTSLSSATVWAEVDDVGIGGREAGVVLDHDGSDTYLAAEIVGDVVPTIDLVLVDAGVPSVLASATVSVGASAALALTRDDVSVEVHLDGVLVVGHVLDGASVATLGAATGAGLSTSSSSVTIDNLRVSPPTSP
jgi:hypothetical protein